MKKEELMYGNKLLFLNEVVTFSHISQIREDGIFWIKTIESKIDSKSFHFKPIPITDEWLLRLPKELNYPKWINYIHELQNWYYWNNQKKNLHINL